MSRELAGRLSERVTLLRQGQGRDALGGASGAWETVASLWAAIEPRPPGPEVIGDARERANRWRVTVRAAAVAVGDRLGWDGRTLAVRSVTADPRARDRLEIEAEELR